MIGNNVTSIGIDAFNENYLPSVTIPDNVTSIGCRAFYNNNLISVMIGDNVTSIGFDAFRYNGPGMNSTDTITRSPISHAYGTRNIVGTTWVKE